MTPERRQELMSGYVNGPMGGFYSPAVAAQILSYETALEPVIEALEKITQQLVYIRTQLEFVNDKLRRP